MTSDGMTLRAPDALAVDVEQPTTKESTTTMEPLKLAISALALAPQIVAGIELIHKDAAGATKLQIARESLALATGAAQAILPGDVGNIAGEVGNALDSIINSVVGIFNSTGLFTHKATA